MVDRTDKAKSYIFYTEVMMDGEPMQCVYLVKNDCRAQPFAVNTSEYYEPTEDEKKSICIVPVEFMRCPRFRQYESFLDKAGLKR